MGFKALLLLSAIVTAVHSTRVHVNRGCILVNNNGICNGAAVGVYDSSAVIFGRFDGNNRDQHVLPGCRLNARWPVAYGDIFYGADNCLYDAKGQNINGQCCNHGMY
ncbi:hypothetical protein LshimejAT787_1201240 [Lyophyllum shimeji]|uniref:Uncharacterized protein n=1 Tax=Lyophyllum shimeji TaxID=47721 RepID=A0A9P3PTP9_LYOSH|nr:hypothetical protein LshimejAT787_1201240 [Lyophyllum shimeji]